MQLVLALDDRSGVLAEIHGRLRRRFGRPAPFRRLDPVSQLVMGMVGGRTRGEVSMAAFEALVVHFGCWEAVRDAPAAEIRKAIGAVTYAERKAPQIKAALQVITAINGRLALDNLADLSVEAALAWLERLPGVGRKVAAATLNFSTLRRRALVIDTHHLRVLQRLGLVDGHCSRELAYERLMPDLPDEWAAIDLDEHHQLIKPLGQTICRYASPACRLCPLNDLCCSASGNQTCLPGGSF